MADTPAASRLRVAWGCVRGIRLALEDMQKFAERGLKALDEAEAMMRGDSTDDQAPEPAPPLARRRRGKRT
jgi:hypothetical protein